MVRKTILFAASLALMTALAVGARPGKQTNGDAAGGTDPIIFEGVLEKI